MPTTVFGRENLFENKWCFFVEGEIQKRISNTKYIKIYAEKSFEFQITKRLIVYIEVNFFFKDKNAIITYAIISK